MRKPRPGGKAVVGTHQELAMFFRKLGGASGHDNAVMCIRCYRFAGSMPTRVLMNSALVMLALLLTQIQCYPQNSEFFDVRSIMRDIKVRYELSPADIHRLGPVIEKENQDVLVIYSRFDGYEDEYPINLWREIIRRRSDFETRIIAGFNPRQKAALRTARTALERRILSFLLEDYVNFLGDFLGLDSLQIEATGNVLSSESKRKHQMITRSNGNPALLQTQLDKLAKDTDIVIRIILSPEQYRLYRSLFTGNGTPIG